MFSLFFLNLIKFIYKYLNFKDDQGIEIAKNYVHDLINKEIENGIPSKRIAIGGFSMGGALALYLSFFNFFF